jgi:hypothetical protein
VIFERRAEASLAGPGCKILKPIRSRSATLKQQQVERRRLVSGKDRAAGVSLAAVMGSMIEQMQQDILHRLAAGLARPERPKSSSRDVVP